MLDPGTRLGPYEVLAPVGAGGMGEVYRARDTRLGRDVAIKVLPEHLSSHPERRARFEREAKTISSLNHPHICALYDVGQHDGADYLVMEYLLGETLAQRLSKGPLPTEPLLRFGFEIADALALAHKQGLVHRDLKPGNVMLTNSGAKLLDFGLAKAQGPIATTGAALSQMATGTQALTSQGTLLGTFQYMAPEQLDGNEADARSDIWALGCVLYEMATGKHAFTGKSQASLIAAILEHEPPPISAIEPMRPRSLDQLVRACLAKDPDARMQSARDVARALGWIQGVVDEHAGTTGAAGTRSRVAPLAATALAAALLSGLAVWNLGRPPVADTPGVSRFVIALPSGQHMLAPPYDDAPGRYPPIALSQDGRKLAYAAATADGSLQLYLRQLDQLEARPLPGTADGELPFFSPDGRWVGFWANGALFKVPLDGGPPVKIGDIRGGARGAAWAPGDTIILGGNNTGLRTIPAGGGRPTELTRTDSQRSEEYHGWPEVLPDGKHVLVTVHTGESADIAVLSLETKEWRLLDGTEHAAQPRYLNSGHLVFFRPAGLFAAPFDLVRMRLTAAAIPIMADLFKGWDAGLNLGFFDVSRPGTLVYVPPVPGATDNRLVLVDVEGREKPLPAETGRYSYTPSVSADGRRLAVSNRTDRQSDDVWVIDLERSTRTRLTSRDANIDPVWSADGKRVIFASFRSGSFDLYWMPADASAEPEALLSRDHGQFPTSASLDGRFVAFKEENPETGSDIQILSLEGKRPAFPFLATTANEREATFSTDGRFLAYASDESGRYEVYVRPFPGPGGKWPISTQGGRRPHWSPLGDELFYLVGSTMMAVRIETAPIFSAGPPRPLFKGGYAGWFDVMPGGKHFVMITRGSAELTTLNAVLNWPSELARLAPPAPVR